MNGQLGCSRREFLGRSAAGVGVPYLLSAAAPGTARRPGPNERIHLGLVGAGSMGRSNLENCARHGDVVVTAVCDAWKERRDAVVAKHPESARAHEDYRELLGRDDVDAVIIASPPHWHALQAIDACAAGKDIYLQKPMTLYPDEALAVRNAVERHGRISQVGTQIHAGENYRRVVETIRSGRIGPVSVARTFMVMNQGREGIGRRDNSAPPAGLDWELWVGPAPLRPYNELIVQDAYHHSAFMAYGGGWTPGMAPHILDLPCWALDLDYPLVTSCSGGRYLVDDIGDIPDVQEVIWQHPELTVTWSMSIVNSFGFDFGRGTIARRLGIYFHGVDGTLFANYGRHEVVPEGDRPRDHGAPQPEIPPSPGHEREWLDAIKTRQAPSCHVGYHVKIDVAIGLANLAHRLGRSVRFDPVRERIVGDEEAARLARPIYRSPWQFPESYLEPLPTPAG